MATLTCVVCIQIESNLSPSELGKLFPDFETEDAITVAKGHAVCGDHLTYFEDKAGAIADKIIDNAREAAYRKWQAGLR